MIDREKVIKGLETCNKYGYECPECPYHDPEDTDGCHAEELMADAIALLKGTENRSAGLVELGISGVLNCKSCGASVMREEGYRFRHCPWCGARIRWEDIQNE